MLKNNKYQNKNMAIIHSPHKSNWDCVAFGKIVIAKTSYSKAKKWLNSKEGFDYEIVNATKNRDCVLTIKN